MKRYGFGQVEPNHLSAQKTGQISAQLPAASSITLLENGQFVKYDLKSGEVNFTGNGEWMMVFNEVHTYDERDRYYCDYAMQKSDYYDGVMVPRCIKINVGDWYTTNTLKAAGSHRANTTMETYAVGNKLTVNASGYLEKNASPATTDMVFEVTKVYTLGDGQEALKIIRIQ